MLTFVTFGFNKIQVSEKFQPNMTIFWAVMGEHIFSYLSMLYRRREIRLYGMPDVNGVLRGQLESYLTSVSVLLSCLIIGFIGNIIVRMPAEEIQASSGFYYWVMIDMILMPTLHGFFYHSMVLQLKEMVYENLNTLIFVQKRIIKERREANSNQAGQTPQKVDLG